MIGPSARLNSSGKIRRYPAHCASDGGRFIDQIPAIWLASLVQSNELLRVGQLHVGRVTTRTAHVGRVPPPQIFPEALLVRTALLLWEKTKREIEDRVRDRQYRRPTVTAPLLQEQPAVPAHTRLCNVKVNRDRAADDGPGWSQLCRARLLRPLRVE